MKSKRILVVAVKFAVIGVTLSPLVPDARAGDENKGFDKKIAAVKTIPLDLFVAPEGMELTRWACSPRLFNPTNIDVDRNLKRLHNLTEDSKTKLPETQVRQGS